MENEPIFRTLEMIEQNISEKLTVENIAGSVHFSKYHYQRLFRSIVGESVMEYVTKRKLTLAGKELLETSATVLDIALRFGYGSHEGFTRAFRAYMGVTPTEYRKYRLTAISQKINRERNEMMYSKTTDEIIREMNECIAAAKALADQTRKYGPPHPEYLRFWAVIADKTDEMARGWENQIARITSIAARPDGITARFDIIKCLEDIAFYSNLLAFNVTLMNARQHPETIRQSKPICDKYMALAHTFNQKSGTIARFFQELSALILADMRKNAADKIQAVVRQGQAAVQAIQGYAYIKLEVESLVNELSALPLAEITVTRLEDYTYRLAIIAFAADMDIFRSPSDKEVFEGIHAFRAGISETAEFFKTLVTPESPASTENKNTKYLTDIAFQGNILLFYIRGEISHEKLGKLSDVFTHERQAAFASICERVNEAIRLAHTAAAHFNGNESACAQIAGILSQAAADMEKEAEILQQYGSVIHVLASEMKNLAERASSLASGL